VTKCEKDEGEVRRMDLVSCWVSWEGCTNKEEQRYDRVVHMTGRRLQQSGSGCDRETWVYEQVGKSDVT
jgi:hypothetical protein